MARRSRERREAATRRRARTVWWTPWLLTAALASACAPEPLAGAPLDAGTVEGVDAALGDGGAIDAALRDADAGAIDAALRDAARPDASAIDAALRDAGAIPTEWPESSVCVLPDGVACTGGVRATGWTAGVAFTWSADEDALGSTLVRRDGTGEVTVARITTASWHAPTGLSVAPDGTLYLGGPFLGPGTVQIGATSVELPFPYNRVLVSLTSEGAVRWHRIVEGITAERLLVAARHDGDVVVAGDLYAGVSVGPYGLLDPEWLADFLVASLDERGAWRWASQLPRQGGAIGDFALGLLGFGASGDIAITGQMRRSLAVNGTVHTCEDPVGCDAVISYSTDGVAIDLQLAR